MNLFYHPNISIDNGSEVVFDKDESRHISKVLRKKEGDLLDVTNGEGTFFTVEITSLMPKQCIASIKTTRAVDPLPYQLHMAVAPTKNNDRFEWFLEKATEIGIHRITPIICEHSERKVIKKERLERIVESAMKQSLKAYKPILDDPHTFEGFLNVIASESSTKMIAYCGDVDKISMNKAISSGDDAIIMIGPEGDFSYKEYQLATQKGFKAITLGDSRLRTETAAIVACHSVSFLNQL